MAKDVYAVIENESSEQNGGIEGVKANSRNVLYLPIIA